MKAIRRFLIVVICSLIIIAASNNQAAEAFVSCKNKTGCDLCLCNLVNCDTPCFRSDRELECLANCSLIYNNCARKNRCGGFEMVLD